MNQDSAGQRWLRTGSAVRLLTKSPSVIVRPWHHTSVSTDEDASAKVSIRSRYLVGKSWRLIILLIHVFTTQAVKLVLGLIRRLSRSLQFKIYPLEHCSYPTDKLMLCMGEEGGVYDSITVVSTISLRHIRR